MQRFTMKESLIYAFNKIMLRGQASLNATQQEKRNIIATKVTGSGKSTGADKSEVSSSKKKTNKLL